jgi:hypothetical protein
MRVDEHVRAGQAELREEALDTLPGVADSVRQATRSVGPGSEAIPSSRAEPLTRPR